VNKKITAAFAASHLVVLLAFAPHAKAEEVDEIVVSATGIPTPISQIGSSVDVITAEDLEQQQITYLQDALKLKGVNVGQNGGPGTLSNVFLRGLPSKHTMLIIDGVAVVDPQLDYPLWSDVVTEGVGQIEILRGPQGVLYGSNTIAGVISQFTAIGGETENSVRLESGEYGTQKTSLYGKGGTSSLEYGYSVSRFETDGFSARTTPQSAGQPLEDDPYENTTFNVKLRASLSDKAWLDVVARSSEGELFTDGFSSDTVGEYEEFERNTGRIALNFEFDNWAHRFGVSMYDNDIQRYGSFPSSADTERALIDYRSVYTFDKATQFIFGATADEADDGANEVDTNAFYALLQRNLSDDLIVTGAVRRDDHDLFGEHDTYRATLAYYLADNALFRLSHGTGYRSPSLDELYSSYAGGNENFRPADSVSTEFGFEVGVNEAIDVRATAFVAEIEDAIEYSFSSFTYQQHQGKTKVSGLEADLVMAVAENLKVTLDAVYTASKRPADDGSDRMQRQGRVPRVQAGLSVDFGWTERLQLSGSVRHVKGAVENVSGSLTDFDDYTLIDLRTSFQMSSSVNAYALLENADDEDYETALGFGTPGRAFYVGVTSSF